MNRLLNHRERRQRKAKRYALLTLLGAITAPVLLASIQFVDTPWNTLLGFASIASLTVMFGSMMLAFETGEVSR